MIVEREEELLTIEIKSGSKITDTMLRELKYWQKLQGNNQCSLLHSGASNEIINERMSVLPWKEIVNL